MEKLRYAVAIPEQGPGVPADPLSTGIRFPQWRIQMNGESASALPLADSKYVLRKIGSFELTDDSIEP